MSQKETVNVDQKMLQQEVTKEYVRQARETLSAVYAEKALGNISKFGDYFKKQNYVALEHVPGYEAEIIQPGVVMAAVVPEDPLFCRVPEMTLKQL
jgi:hypothetical protein